VEESKIEMAVAVPIEVAAKTSRTKGIAEKSTGRNA
jgi:hypothetical protein